MKLGVISANLMNYEFEEGLQHAQDLGLKAIETGGIGLWEPVGAKYCPIDKLLADRGEIRRWLEAHERYGLEISALGAHGAPLIPDKEGAKKYSLDFRKQCKLAELAGSLGVEVVFYQSNVEGNLVDCIQENWGKIQGIIVNPGALTHYGLTLKDTLIDSGVPVIEVHLGNPHAREEWRRVSVISDIARGQIAGFGWRSYTAAIEILAGLIQERETDPG